MYGTNELWSMYGRYRTACEYGRDCLGIASTNVRYWSPCHACCFLSAGQRVALWSDRHHHQSESSDRAEIFDYQSGYYSMQITRHYLDRKIGSIIWWNTLPTFLVGSDSLIGHRGRCPDGTLTVRMVHPGFVICLVVYLSHHWCLLWFLLGYAHRLCHRVVFGRIAKNYQMFSHFVWSIGNDLGLCDFVLDYGCRFSDCGHDQLRSRSDL